MAKITWKGEGDEKETQRWGMTFKKGESQETDNPDFIRKAKGNPNFEVDEEKHDAPATYRAPSEMSAQGPVPKPGEPVVDRDQVRTVVPPPKAK
jgi:hypothetical protein